MLLTSSPTMTMQCAIIGAESKKQVLEKIARFASEMDHTLNHKDVLEALQRREKLGSTAMGHGVAIPHTRIPFLEEPLCIIFRLTNPIRFSETEEQPVNMVFALLVPEQANETHLRLLAEISQRCRNKAFREQFLAAKSNQELFHLFHYE